MKSESALRPAREGALHGQPLLLLAVLTLYNCANALSGVFVPVYLFKANQSYALVGLFSLLQYAAGGLCAYLAGSWAKRKGLVASLRTGIAVSGAFYLAVLLLGSKAASWAAPLGLLSGTAGGFFWLAYNVLYFEITERDNRDAYNGMAGLLGSAVAMAAPFLSGLVISGSGGNAGYTLIFSVSLALFGAAALLSAKIKKRPPQGRYRWSFPAAELRQPESPWRRFAPAIALQGLRDGVFLFVLGLAIYASTGAEQKVGTYYLVTSLVGMAAFWLCGRKLGPERRRTAMLAGTLALAAALLPLLGGMSYASLLLVGIGTALFSPLYLIPITSSVFDLMGRSEEAASSRVELTVLRELALTTGRLAGVLAFIAVAGRSAPDSPSFAWLLLALGSAPIAGWFIIRNRLRPPGSAIRAADADPDGSGSG
ncbi:MFS transporter [Paenibacillus albicereus]|uniref:MFS transporter n=1 Tax=Paenibacillus albicereus TaxID=2726185 RepID=A0A6H2GW38_9BACL|nr:MFS transporter [Paenibacillus albicereus]QJC51358.1 MFS transporter [Paenibacillus albicereus]